MKKSEIIKKVNAEKIKLTFTPKFYRITVKEDCYSNTNDPYFIEEFEFTNVKKAVDCFHKELQTIEVFNANENPDYKTIEFSCWDDENYNMEVLIEETFTKTYDADFGKLVIIYQHIGKGMNYAHKFQSCFFLNKYNVNQLCANTDNRFVNWSMILNLTKEDLEKLTHDEAIEEIEKEARLKLQHNINIDELNLNLIGNE